MLKGIVIGVFHEKDGPMFYRSYPEAFIRKDVLEDLIVDGFIETTNKKWYIRDDKDYTAFGLKAGIKFSIDNFKDYFVVICVFGDKKKFAANQIPVTKLIRSYFDAPVDLKELNLSEIYNKVNELLRKEKLLGGLL